MTKVRSVLKAPRVPRDPPMPLDRKATGAYYSRRISLGVAGLARPFCSSYLATPKYGYEIKGHCYYLQSTIKTSIRFHYYDLAFCDLNHDNSAPEVLYCTNVGTDTK